MGKLPKKTPEAVIRLIDTFSLHRESYLSGKYKETPVRREFIDPLFVALRWDIDNSQGYAEAYKDIVHEDAIKVSGKNKTPGYCFRVGRTRKISSKPRNHRKGFGTRASMRTSSAGTAEGRSSPSPFLPTWRPRRLRLPHQTKGN